MAAGNVIRATYSDLPGGEPNFARGLDHRAIFLKSKGTATEVSERQMIGTGVRRIGCTRFATAALTRIDRCPFTSGEEMT